MSGRPGFDFRGRTMSGRVGAEQTPDIEAFVAAALRGVLDPGSIVKRGPDHDGNEYGEHMNVWQRRALREALAPILAAAVREARAAAWDEGSATEAVEAAEIVRQGRDGFLGSDGLDPAWIAGWHAATDHHESRLRDRADRIAVDAPEGGEGR